jgi:hypothetical protein
MQEFNGFVFFMVRQGKNIPTFWQQEIHNDRYGKVLNSSARGGN